MDELAEAVQRCAEYGGGSDAVWPVPEDATIRLGDDPNGHMLAGAVIARWADQ
jgi:hypothetical protein